MKGRHKLPFQGLSSEAWLNLLLVPLVTTFFINLVLPLIQNDWCKAVDFCGYYSAGQVMNDGKIADIYNLDILKKYQDNIFRLANSPEPRAEAVAMLYLPVFILPFRLFARLDLPVSLLLWDFLNFVILILYLEFFSKSISRKALKLQLLILILIAFPVFRNFLDGRVNVWLLICFGEFVRAIVTNKEIKAGLWLGGVLLKPQLLILVLPFLLIQKKYRAILGFVITSIILFGVSFILVGWEGLMNLKDVILEASKGGVSSFFVLMMNWRALGYFLSDFISPDIGKAVFIGGSAMTSLVPLIVFRKKSDSDSAMFVVGLLGIMAATTAVAYHAHIHMAMILIPFILYLYLTQQIPRKWFLFWILFPGMINIALFVIVTLVSFGILPEFFNSIVMISYGPSMLIANLVLLGWAVSQNHQGDQAQEMDQIPTV